MAHIDAGKTTITERILFYTGITHKIGEVHDGDTTMDWMVQERERGITITAAATTCYWSGTKNQYVPCRINIIDTPGHVDFTIEVERSLRVLDGAVAVFCAVGGVEPQSETVWRQADKHGVPRVAFINKLDREGADFFSVVKQMKSFLSTIPIPVQVPHYIDNNFCGIVDIITMEYTSWDSSENLCNYKIEVIPNDLLGVCKECREFLIESVIESDDLLDKYFSGKLNIAEIKECVRIKTLENKIVPVFCGSAFKNKGVQLLLDGIVDYLPAPCDTKFIRGVDIITSKEITRIVSDSESFTALVFKIGSDPFFGTLSFMRVYSGTCKPGDVVYNSTKDKKERFSRLVLMHANNKVDIDFVCAGDIVAAVGLKNTLTGDTLCCLSDKIVLEKIIFPESVISIALEPRTKGDQEKLGLSLHKLMQEDPSFTVKYNKETGEMIISGMGELHLDIITDRLRREFGVNISTGVPVVAYRETITKCMRHEYKHVKQSGGRGQYGHVVLLFEPGVLGSGFVFLDKIVGGVIPKEYVKAIRKGIEEQMQSGVLSGHPVVDIIVSVVDGSYHAVDSSEIAFKIASAQCFREGTRLADAVLLEPVMNVSVLSAEEYVGDIVGDLSRRRGFVGGITDIKGTKNIKVLVPLSEMFGYATVLRSISKGRSTYTMEFCKYSVVPKIISDSIIKRKVDI